MAMPHGRHAAAARPAPIDNRQLVMDAFEASYEHVVRYITLRLGNRDQAEDIASEVFVRALKNANSFKPGEKPIEAWLFRIAHNLLVDHLRKQSRRTPPVPLEDAGEIPTPDEAVTQTLLNDDIASVKDAMTHLTDAERQVVAMRFAGEMTPDEIGKALGKSAGAVRWLQHSAIGKLRKRLATDGQER